MSRFFKVYGSQVLSVLAIVSLLGAGIIGQLPEETDTPDDPSNGTNGLYDPQRYDKVYLAQAFPQASDFRLELSEPDEDNYLYTAIGDEDEIIGYVTITMGEGYMGLLKVVVVWSLEGTILDLWVPEHGEEEDFFSELEFQGFYNQYVGRSYTEPLTLYKDIDAASGSSYSSNGVARGVRDGKWLVAQYISSI